MTNNILTNNNTTMADVNNLINYVVSAAIFANEEGVKIYNGYSVEVSELISKFQSSKSDQERTEIKWRVYQINKGFGYLDLGSLNPSRAKINAKLELLRQIDKFCELANMDQFARTWKEAIG